MTSPTVSFKTQVASDVIRDGLGVELLDSSNMTVAEVFRCDRDRTLIVTTFGNDVPFEAMNELLDRARQRLDPFEDGTPLATATLCAAKPTRPVTAS